MSRSGVVKILTNVAHTFFESAHLGLSCSEVLLEWRWEAEGGLDRGGPKGSGSPTTFMFEML